jgi:hypothetical protein
MRALWKKYIVGHNYFEEKNRERIEYIHGHGERNERRKWEKEQEARKEEAMRGAEQKATFKLVDRFLHGENEGAKRSLSWSRRRGRNAGNGIGVPIPMGRGGVLDVGELEKGHRITEDDEL